MPVSGDKKCSRCNEVKPVELFTRYRVCKACNYGMTSEWKKKNKEKVAITNHKSYLKRKDNTDYKTTRANWEAANREKQNARKLLWRKANPEKVREIDRATARKGRKNLNNMYIKSVLRHKNLSITPELIECQRAILKLKRLTKCKTLTT